MADSSLVWYTGAGDLRVDHLQSTDIPLFVVDPDVHLRGDDAALRRLHTALLSLERDCKTIGTALHVRVGPAGQVVAEAARACSAVSCLLVEDDVDFRIREMQRDGCARLVADGVKITRWSVALRPEAGWEEWPQLCPATFDKYVAKAAEFRPSRAERRSSVAFQDAEVESNMVSDGSLGLGGAPP